MGGKVALSAVLLSQGSSLVGHDTPQYPCGHPKKPYQAGQDICGDEHVENIVPSRGGNEPSQQGPQGRACGSTVSEQGTCQGTPGPAHGTTAVHTARPRPDQRSVAKSQSWSRTYGPGAVDDGCDGGQRLCIALQALVSPLGRESRMRAQTRPERH